MSTNQVYKVLIADDQELTRRGIESIIHELAEYVVCGFVFSAHELESQLSLLQPHILIIDFDNFDFDDLESFCQLLKASAHTQILVVSDNKNKDEIIKMRDLGIRNHILKTTNHDEFIDALNSARLGKKYYSEEILDLLVGGNSQKDVEKVRFTASEIEIIKLIAQGLTTKEIASRKFLSSHTIITHRKNIFRKAGVTSTSELIMQAIRTGIVDTLEYYI
jgi:DNA-binding NarL/FixJ family response regulator